MRLLVARRRELVVDHAQRQHVIVPGETVAADLIGDVAAEALICRGKLADRDRRITEVLGNHPDASLVQSVPGMWATRTAEFLEGGRWRDHVVHNGRGVTGSAPNLASPKVCDPTTTTTPQIPKPGLAPTLTTRTAGHRRGSPDHPDPRCVRRARSSHTHMFAAPDDTGTDTALTAAIGASAKIS